MPRKPSPTLKKALQRAHELKSQGKTWAEVTEIITLDGFVDTTGNPYTLSNLRSHYSRAGGDLSSEHSEPSPYEERAERSEQEESPISQPALQAPSDLEERMTAIAREVFMELIQNTPNIQTDLAPGDAPPEPEMLAGSRKESRKYAKISATLDKNLLKLFNREKKRLRMSTGKLMDRILWAHYGKPLLSYQSEREEESE